MIKELLDLVPTSVSLTGQVRAAIAAKYICQLTNEGATNATIALLLNAKGLTTAHDKPFTPSNISRLKQRLKNGENSSYQLGWELEHA